MPETAKEDLGLPGRRPSTNRGPGQLLADRLRSKWERERASKLQRLREQSQRQRETEIRQLLQAKEAQLRQMQQLADLCLPLLLALLPQTLQF